MSVDVEAISKQIEEMLEKDYPSSKYKKDDVFPKYQGIIDKYLPKRGQGKNLANQTVKATYYILCGFYAAENNIKRCVYDTSFCKALTSYNCNEYKRQNLSHCANWLYVHIPETRDVLDEIKKMKENMFDKKKAIYQYEEIILELAEVVFNEELLSDISSKEKQGSIYCEYPNLRSWGKGTVFPEFWVWDKERDT